MSGIEAYIGQDDEQLLADEEQLECQICGEVETILLGTLGDTTHYRCRACGADSYDRPPRVEDPLKVLLDAVDDLLTNHDDVVDNDEQGWDDIETLRSALFAYRKSP